MINAQQNKARKSLKQKLGVRGATIKKRSQGDANETLLGQLKNRITKGAKALQPDAQREARRVDFLEAPVDNREVYLNARLSAIMKLNTIKQNSEVPQTSFKRIAFSTPELVQLGQILPSSLNATDLAAVLAVVQANIPQVQTQQLANLVTQNIISAMSAASGPTATSVPSPTPASAGPSSPMSPSSPIMTPLPQPFIVSMPPTGTNTPAQTPYAVGLATALHSMGPLPSGPAVAAAPVIPPVGVVPPSTEPFDYTNTPDHILKKAKVEKRAHGLFIRYTDRADDVRQYHGTPATFASPSGKISNKPNAVKMREAIDAARAQINLAASMPTSLNPGAAAFSATGSGKPGRKAREKETRAPNSWILFLKKYSKDHGIKYFEAVGDPKAKAAYQIEKSGLATSKPTKIKKEKKVRGTKSKVNLRHARQIGEPSTSKTPQQPLNLPVNQVSSANLAADFALSKLPNTAITKKMLAALPSSNTTVPTPSSNLNAQLQQLLLGSGRTRKARKCK